jgi:uncharacterized protein (TIGR03435 family)
MKKERAEDDVVASVGGQLRQRVPSAAEEQAVLDRVWGQVRQQPEHMGRLRELRRAAGRWRAIQMAAAAVLVVAAAIGTAVVWRPTGDTLFRVVDDETRVGDPPLLPRSVVGTGTGTIRSNGDGAVLELADGSSIEMRLHSALSLERAHDGVRIRLASGGIIVNAAKQRTGHLYVQTKDMTVSVVGTVFLVNAEEKGSRVAVLEGEVMVQVQEGRPETTLLPGEQVVTNSSMPSRPVREVIAWSRNAGRLLALLQQSAVKAPPVQPAAVSAEARAAFEAVSIRRAAPSSVGGRGRGAPASSGPPCGGVDLQVDPSRFAVRNIPLYGLITLAYGKECQRQVQHIGGPAWVGTDGYDVEAAIPAGSPGYTTRQVREGMAPRLQLMLQAMLADRFKLVIRREMREMSVYNLVVVAAAKVKPSAEQNPVDRVPAPGNVSIFKPTPEVVGPALALSGVPMSRVAALVQMMADRPIIDRTELTGLFDVFLNFPDLAGLSGDELQTAMADQLSSRLQEQLGLKLEPARVPVEVLVIDRAERPSEN